jgi:CrcB protein
VEPWIKVAVLSLGGALGVNARYWLGVWMSYRVSPQFPWATFTINVSGCFAIGFSTVLLSRWLPHPDLRLLVIVGFLGGYTTFSSYTFESLTLVERGEPALALAYVLGSLVVGLIAVTVGVIMGRALGPAS